MGADNYDDLSPELARLGKAVEHLPKDAPPADLVARTLSRISAGYRPIKRVFWLLRPITHPLARVAAAAIIIAAFAPMTDMNLADPLGARIEARIIGSETADRFEGFLDSVLYRHGSYSQDELDSVIGIRRPTFTPVRRMTVAIAKPNRA